MAFFLRSFGEHLGVSALLVTAACGDGVGAVIAPVPESNAATIDATLPPPDDDPPPPPPSPPAAPPLSEPKLAAFFADPSNQVTAEVFETVLLRIATCTAEPGWVARCPAYDDLMKLVGRHHKGGDEFPAEPALRNLRHPATTVRATAVSFASSFVFDEPKKGPRDAATNAVREQLWLDALRSEKDVDVLESLVEYSAPGAARNPKVRGFVVRSLAHAAEAVRVSALGVIARPDVVGHVPDAFTWLASATKADHPGLERAAACENVGKIEDARAVPLLAELLASDALSDDLRGACFAGLVGTWTRKPAPKEPSRDGYELTLRILEKKPRSPSSPHERGIEALTSATFAAKSWEQKVVGFYDVRAVSAALASITLDDDAGGRARLHAGKSLVKLGRRETIEQTVGDLKRRGGELPLLLAADMEKEAKRESFLRF